MERQLEKASEEAIARLRAIKDQIDEKCRKLTKHQDEFDERLGVRLQEMESRILSQVQERMESCHAAAMTRLDKVDQVRRALPCLRACAKTS